MRIPEPFGISSVSRRLRRAQELLRKHRLHSLLVTDLKNILYLTGMKLSVGMLIIVREGTTLFVDQRYREMAQKRAPKAISLIDPASLKEFLQGLTSIGFDEDQVSVGRYERWKTTYKNKKFVQTSGLIEGLRRQKDSGEIHCIEAACALTKKALREIPSMLRYKMSELDLAWKIRSFCRLHGAEEMAFDTIVAFGEHTSRPHHHPTDRRLQKGDLVQVDMGVKCHDYCSDYSRVYFTAEPTPEQYKALRALRKAKRIVEALLRPGVTNKQLDETARKVLREEGYPDAFPHALGHGVGLDIHEGVTLSSKQKSQKLLRGEVVTIEPGLYFEGKWGMRIEDTWVVG